MPTPNTAGHERISSKKQRASWLATAMQLTGIVQNKAGLSSHPIPHGETSIAGPGTLRAKTQPPFLSIEQMCLKGFLPCIQSRLIYLLFLGNGYFSNNLND
jgi:hypothetical protein